MPCTGDYFGDSALELSGTVVAPKYQQAFGVGTRMLSDAIQALHPEFIFAHTRNPAILRLMGRFCAPLIPDTYDKYLQDLALDYSPEAQVIDNVAYHVNRYGEDGLYNGFDPAERVYGTSGVTLKERLHGLNDIGTALVVVGKVNKRGNL